MLVHCFKLRKIINKAPNKYDACKHCIFLNRCEIKKQFVYLGYIK